MLQEKSEDTKGVIRSRKLKDRQRNSIILDEHSLFPDAQ